MGTRNVGILKISFIPKYNINFINIYSVELPEYLSLNQYNQMFSYIRWYHYEEQFVALNRTSYHLSHEVAEFINKSFDDVTIKQ